MDQVEITFWHWLILGLALLGGELLLPGIYLLWIGIAALVAGGVIALLPELPLLGQALVFAVLVLISAIVGRRVYGRPEPMGNDTVLNRRAAAYVGRVVSLAEPIANGRGRARIDDTTWAVSGPDLPEGAAVKVVGCDGIVLRVEPAGS